jgi:hypothetical protein
VSARMDAHTDFPTALHVDGAAQLSGTIDHAPTLGGSSLEIRNMVATMTPPYRTCSCGFGAFLWQKVCPQCDRPF